MRTPFSSWRAVPSDIRRAAQSARDAADDVKALSSGIRYSTQEVELQARRTLASVELAVWVLVGGALVLMAADVALNRGRLR